MPPRQGASPGVPDLWVVQGPSGHRDRLVTPPRPRPEASPTGGLPVAVDAMGGDNAPGEIVAGARRAAEELGIPVVLVGPTDGSLGDPGGLEVLPAFEVIAMNDDPAQSVRTTTDARLRVA